jgi:hypothetical protein
VAGLQGLWGSRTSQVALSSGDRPSPVVGHDRRRIAAAAVPDLSPDAEAGLTAATQNLCQGRRAVGVTARGRGAAPCQPEPPPGLGRPGRVRRPHPLAAHGPPRPSLGHPGHHPALASPPRTQEVDLPEPARTTTDQRHHRRADRADGTGEPELGIHADPGRAAQTRPPRRRLHDPPDPEAPPNPTSTGTTHRHHLAGGSCAPRPAACWPSTSSTSTVR